VGFYNPVAAERDEGLRISHERIAYWTEHGARLSETVAMLVKRASAARPAEAAAPAPAAG